MPRKGSILNILRNTKEAIKDLKSPTGKFAKAYEKSVKETADYAAQKMQTFLSLNYSKTGNLIEGIRNSWVCEYPDKVEITNVDKMNAIVGPLRKSPYNPNTYSYKGVGIVQSYWPFVLFGWGDKQFGTGEYDLWIRLPTGERTSPFNPIRDQYKKTQIDVITHLGFRAKNYRELIDTDLSKYFYKLIEKRELEVIKSFGLN